MEPYIDSERFRDVQHRPKIRARDAVWWRDALFALLPAIQQTIDTLRIGTSHTRVERYDGIQIGYYQF